MPDGKVGDHPFTDIVIRRREVYSAIRRSSLSQRHRLSAAEAWRLLLREIRLPLCRLGEYPFGS
jgi:hypothetical protein